MSVVRPLSEKFLDTGRPVDICTYKWPIWAQMAGVRTSGEIAPNTGRTTDIRI